MRNTTLTLTALAGVVGIGFVFVIQAQRGINQPVNQQQNSLSGPELVERIEPSLDEIEPVFSDEVIQIEQSEPVFGEESIGDDPQQTPSPIRSDQTFQPAEAEEDQFRALSSEFTDEHHTPSGGGLDFSDSGNRILKAGFDDSETSNSPTESSTESPALFSEDESSETPRVLIDIPPLDSIDVSSLPEFDTPPADSREPLFPSNAETPGDSIFSSDEKDAEIPSRSSPEFDGEPDAETPGDAISLPKRDFSSETPGDFVPAFERQTDTETPGDTVLSPKDEFVGEILDDSVSSSTEKFTAETPGDSVSSSEEKFVGEIPGDTIPFGSMPKLSESGLAPFGTPDAVTSSEGKSPTETHPILDSQDQSNPFNFLQSPEKNAENTPTQTPSSNHLEQFHPLMSDLPSPVVSKNPDKTDDTADFFPADEIKTNDTNHRMENEASSPTSAASPFPSKEMPEFDPELKPVPTINSQTAESDQPEAFPETTSTPVLPDREETPLTGQPVSSAESRDPFDSQIPNLLELGNSPSPVQGVSPNPFHVTPEADPLKTKDFQPSDGVGNRDNLRAAQQQQQQQQQQLHIEKTAPPNAVLGEPMIYSIIVQNMGTLAVHQVMVVDRIPKGTELMGTIPQAELDGNRLIWKIGTFQPNEKRKILVRITPREVGQIGSIATVHFFSEVSAETKIKKPELKLSISGPSQARLGELVVYRFKVTNTGTQDAKQVFIRDIIPDGLSHPGGKDLEYSVGTLQAGKSEEIELTLTAETLGTTANRALVTAEGGVRIEKSVSLKIVASPLIISRTGPKQTYLDRQTTAINLLTNDSNHPLENITVTESVPRGMKFIEASSGGRFDSVARNVVWSIDRLGPKQSMELKVKLVPTVVGTQTSVIQAIDADGMMIELTSQTTIQNTAALAVDVVSLKQSIAVGEQYTLRVFARNRGSASATNVQARFFVSDELEIVSVQGPVQYAQKGKQIVFSPIPEVKEGMQAIYILTLKAKQSGKAQVRVDINADQFNRPLIRDEAISILPAN